MWQEAGSLGHDDPWWMIEISFRSHCRWWLSWETNDCLETAQRLGSSILYPKSLPGSARSDQQREDRAQSHCAAQILRFFCSIIYINNITWYGYGSIPIDTFFSGMNIHLPAILMFTRGTRFWHTAICVCLNMRYSPNPLVNPTPPKYKTPPFPGSQYVKIPVGMVGAMAIFCIPVPKWDVCPSSDIFRGLCQRVYLHFCCLNTKFLLNFASLDGHFRMFLIIVSNVDGELPALMAKSVKSLLLGG